MEMLRLRDAADFQALKLNRWKIRQFDTVEAEARSQENGKSRFRNFLLAFGS